MTKEVEFDVKTWRESHNLSAEKLGGLLGVTAHSIWKMERQGRTKKCYIWAFAGIAAALNKSKENG